MLRRCNAIRPRLEPFRAAVLARTLQMSLPQFLATLHSCSSGRGPMRIQRGFLLVAMLGALTVSAVSSATPPGRIRVEGEPGVQLRIRASGDGNVSLVSAAAVYSRQGANVDVLAPAEFAIKPGGTYYARFDAADSTATILVAAEGGPRFGFGSLGSRYTGVTVVCGSPRGSEVHPLPRGTSLADRSCPE